jgi:hypothetical protein
MMLPGKRLWFLFADHHGALWNGAGEVTGAERVAPWAKRWPAIAYEG